MSNRKSKPSPEHLRGTKEQRVFVGGQYDFMPTLRLIAQFVSEMSSDERPLVPIIAADFKIEVEETMDWDIGILMQCKYAIFDLSDLGAQLVEMQVADENHMDVLLVYPVRERRNEPERGRRTVLSFGLPHFGYLTFRELKSIVWRFLMDAPIEKDYPTRVIHDPILDREIRRIRALLGQGDMDGALEIVNQLQSGQYKDALEPWLYRGIIGRRKSDEELASAAFKKATDLGRGDKKKEAEVWYFKGVAERLKVPTSWEAARDNLMEAEKRQPHDGRILQLLGRALWELGFKTEALEKSRKVLEELEIQDPDVGIEDREIPDPVVVINAMNNVAYFLCEEIEVSREKRRELDEALMLTQYLPAYHKVFSRRDGLWLDTRGFALILKAEQLLENKGQEEEALEVLEEAVGVLTDAAEQERNDQDIHKRLERARSLKRELKKKISSRGASPHNVLKIKG